MADQDWTVPKVVGSFYSDPYDKDSDKILVTRGFIMWLLRESARLSAQVQVVELQDIKLKAEIEQLKEDNGQLEARCNFLEDKPSYE